MQAVAISNLERLELSERVTFKLRNIEEGFDETGEDALFLDVPNPYDYIPQVRKALKPGGFSAQFFRLPIKSHAYWSSSAGITSPSSRCWKFCCGTTRLNRNACARPTAWWHTRVT